MSHLVLDSVTVFPADARGPLHDFANFWWPLGYHCLVGTWWWYVLGHFLWRRMRSAAERGSKHTNDDV